LQGKIIFLFKRKKNHIFVQKKKFQKKKNFKKKLKNIVNYPPLTWHAFSDHVAVPRGQLTATSACWMEEINGGG
jgi:hypothetical protein